MIETRRYFILYHHQHDSGIFTRRSRRAEPNIVTTFKPPITNDRKAAERGVKLNRAIEIAHVDSNVRPANRHWATIIREALGLNYRTLSGHRPNTCPDTRISPRDQ